MLLQRPSLVGFARPNPSGCKASAKPSLLRATRFDGAFASLGFEDVQEQMSAAQTEMDRQFADLTRQFAEMDRGFAEMDREFAGLSRGITGFEAPSAPSRGYEVQRFDDGPSVWSRSYRPDGSRPSGHFYISVEVRSSGNHWAPPPPHHAAAFPGPPVTLLAALFFGAYAAAAAAFFAKYDLTLYQKQRQWQLTLLWPVLCLSSSSFRRQFMAVLRGTRPRVATALEGAEADVTGS